MVRDPLAALSNAEQRSRDTTPAAMEEGSLLQQALQHQSTLQNTLVIDVYLVHDLSSLTGLAQLADELNQHFTKTNYPWLAGGDGVVFGVHVSERIPHLRAAIDYGAAVGDEWMAIGIMLEASRCNAHIVVECTDVDDGQVLFIEAADKLPDWVDAIGPEYCQHRCWIQHGQVHLIQSENVHQPGFLSLSQALECLRDGHSLPDATVTMAIAAAVTRASQPQRHCAALAVPRSVAGLLQRRPDILAPASVAFAEHAGEKDFMRSANLLAGTCEDWVWTTAAFSRSAYAMLRTTLAAPHWTTEDALPRALQSPEVRRLQRQARVESSVHLRHAVALGARLVAGIDYLLRQPASLSVPAGSLTERRVLEYWTRVEQECRAPPFIAAAWHAGPNHAALSLESILQCPVFTDEVAPWPSPLTHPMESWSVQIRRELLRPNETVYHLPGPSDVDDEAWMTLDEASMARAAAADKGAIDEPKAQDTTEATLDQVMGGVDSFLRGSGQVEGVDSAIDINPTVFLNILHATLKATSADELVFGDDPFFSPDDYAMGEQMNDDDDDGDEPNEMSQLMRAMDQELAVSTGDSRHFDSDGLDDEECHDEVLEQAHVLSNLLKSLDSGAGASGPVKTILEEMGIQAPDVLED